MKTIREQFIGRLLLLTTLLIAGFHAGIVATGTPNTGTIRYTGTDFEGRLQFQLQWNVEIAGNYLVQSADVLSSSNGWKTVDLLNASLPGVVRWTALESGNQKFYRLVLPQPEIFSVEPGVMDTSISNQYLYILGQALPTNADVVIDGVHFTPEIINSNGVWARVLLNGLPPGEPVLDLTVIDNGTGATAADFPYPIFVVDAGAPYLLELPSSPPAAPAQRHKRKDGAIAAADYNLRTRPVGEVCDDGNSSEVMGFSGEVQHQVADLTVPGRGLDFVWVRTYRSRATQNGSLGTRWTCSYDVRVQPLGGDVIIHDGTGRADRYFSQTNGTYACPGLFREGTMSNNVFTLTFPDGGVWQFNPLDGTASGGKLDHLMNGNGNIVKLYYDTSGRLTQIVDDLNRTNTVAYNSDSQVQSVTDFGGRTVTYAYYQSGETGGSPGDLKSVTSPPVTGTPNGNDFPQGKTTTYTYSSGYQNDAENHLLLSVTDPLGQTVSQFIYQHNQTDLEFLHCISVQRGTNTPAMFSCLPQTPSPENQFAVVRCIANDPEGDVMELCFDARNRCVAEREYTGRATPGLLVTDSLNRPTGKLRSSDPDFYETRWTWNDDSLCTSVMDPDGSSSQMLYQKAFNQNASRSNHTRLSLHDGDLLVLHEYSANGAVVDLDGDGIGDAAERVWRFEYDPRFGSDPTATPGKKLYVGNLPGIDEATANMRTRLNELEQRLNNLGMLGRSSSGNGDPIANLGVDKVSGTGLAIFDRLDATDNLTDNSRIRPRGWDGTIKGRMESSRIRPKGWDGTIKGLVVPDGNGVAINTKGTGAEKGRVSGGKGWDGTIKGQLALTDCDDSDPKRHHPTAALLENDFVTSFQDPRGHVTTATYDDQGNCLHVSRPAQDPIPEDFAYNTYGQLTAITNPPDANGYRRVDTFSYYASGPQAGYLQSIAIDEPGMHLTSSFEYDSRGNVTRCVDPNGNDWLYTYNALDQCVRYESPTNHTARCATDIYYDAADNVQAVIAEVRDDSDTKLGSRVVVRGFDRSHRLRRITCDVDSNHAMTNDYAYDGNDRCVLMLGGDAVSGADPHQAVAYQYDERGLLFRQITAPGSPLAGTNEISYNAVGQPATKQYTDAGDAPRVSSCTYDGFHRLSSLTDPMGNRAEWFFDANDDLKAIRCFGETNDVAGDVGNIRLAESRYDYDSLDRCVRVHAFHFDPTTQAPVGDGEATTSYGYAPNDECISETNDLGHVTAYGYDTAGRPATVTKPQMRTEFAVLRDRFGNATNRVETDLSDLGGPPQVFSVACVYDSQNRCVQTTDNAGNTCSYSYDSLGRCVKTVDARGTSAFYAYDLLGRCTLAIGDLDGDGSPDFTGDVTRQGVWSSSSDRLLSLTDSHSNTTSYAYDTLGNCTNIFRADGTHCSLVWSPRSNLILYGDANGSVISNSYDLNDRIIHRDIAARTTAGVAATTTFETFEYDGRGCLTGHHNDSSDGYLSYDSLRNCTGESLNGLATHSAYDAVGNRLSLAYPGGRSVAYSYDALERCIGVSESGKSQATYSYDGPDRVSRVALGNNTLTRIFYDGISGQPNLPGDHGWQQVARVAHGAGGSAFSDSSFQYDASQNKISRSVIIPGGSPRTNSMSLQYDLASRLTESLVTDNSALTRDTVYGLDRMGNRTNVTGAVCSGPYTLDPSALGPSDYQMNQYTTTPCDNRTYDDNGNLTSRDSSGGVTNYIYDPEDRLVSVQTLDFSSGTGTIVPIADYRYDALGRRISRTLYSSGKSTATQYCYDGGRPIEERQNGTVSVSFLVDDRRLLGLRMNGKDYYSHCDDQGNTLALTDQQGGVVERYQYDDYGAVTFLTSDGTPTGASSSAYGNAYLFGGMRYDAESGFHCDDGSGYLETSSGRYLLRAGVPLRFDGGGSYMSLVYDYRGVQARTGDYDCIVQDNPWSGGGGGGGCFSEKSRDYLYTHFQNGDIPTGNDRLTRNVVKTFFEKGDKPAQAQFGALIDSALNLTDDRGILGLRNGLCGKTDHFIVGEELANGAFNAGLRSSWKEFSTAADQEKGTPRH